MRILVLGCDGSIGNRHWGNINQLGHMAIGWDPNGRSSNCDRAELIARADAVVVASPSKQHAHDFLDVITAGKHVLVEKPFGYDCPPYMEGLVKGARMKDPSRIIATGFNCRFHHSVNYAKAIMCDDQLGDIQAASFSVLQKSEKPAYLRDGVIRNWLSHEIDLAHHFFRDGEFFADGEVEMCTADDQREANITMKFPNVAERVYINGDYFTEPHQRYFWIEGSKASLYVNLERREIYKRPLGGAPDLVHQAHDTWDATYIEEMKHFIQSIELGYHVEPLATGEDGVRALYTVMAAREKAGLCD